MSDQTPDPPPPIIAPESMLENEVPIESMMPSMVDIPAPTPTQIGDIGGVSTIEEADRIPFDEQDFINLKWACIQIKIIETTHRNLGLPTIFAKLIDLSNLGVFFTGPRGVGKTTIVRTIGAQLPDWRFRDHYNVSRLSPKGMGKIQARFDKASISIYNMDFASFSTDYLKDAALGLFSSLIYDHEMTGETMGLSLSIENCRCGFISTIQPILYKKISENDQFEAQSKDRFLRYFHLQFQPTLDDMKFKLPRIVEMAHLKDIVPNSLERLGEVELPSIPIEIRSSIEYRRMVAVLQGQTSKNRGPEYTARLLQASAFFNNRKIITMSDVKFLCLYIPFLNMETHLSRRENVAEPLKFNADAYTVFDYICTFGKASPSELEHYFQLRKRQHYNVDERKRSISKSTLREDTFVLRAEDMIIGRRIPIRGQRLSANPYFTVHPEWDADYRLPVLRFLEKSASWVSRTLPEYDHLEVLKRAPDAVTAPKPIPGDDSVKNMKITHRSGKP